MTTDLTIPEFTLPPLVIPSELQSEIGRLLSVPALMCKCDTAEQNQAIANARGDLDRLARNMEKGRKRITDPVNGWLTTVKAAVDTAKEPMLREIGRLDALTADFTRRQQQLQREREEAARREQKRIEEEAAAEAKKIVEAAAAGAVAPDVAAQQIQEVQEQAEEKIAMASKPVGVIKARGQTARKVWKITQINDFVLIKSRPDLVRKIEWDMVALKAALDETGKNLPGVTAVEDFTMGSRGGNRPGFIEA